MPLPFEEFEGQGVFDFSSSSSRIQKFYVGVTEPTSVLDATSPPTSSSTTVDPGVEKCGLLKMEDWEGVLPVGFSSQQQSIMGDSENPSMGLSYLLQAENGFHDMEFNAGFGFENINSSNCPQIPSDFPLLTHNAAIGSVFNQNPNFLPPQLVINQNQAHFSQNPAVFLPLSYAQSPEHHLLSPPPAKRLNSNPIGPNSRPPEFFRATDEQITTAQQLQQAVIQPVCQAAELIETGNPALAQGILARLNHQLSKLTGKPQIRAAFYFKEALLSLLNRSCVSPFSLVFKIGAFKSFSEISPIIHFSNFTCNQALLEAFEGSDKIHIVDFDIGYGVQWGSLMQDLAMRNGSGNYPSLKITAFVSPSSHDEHELRFTQESLKLFANEINLPFELEILGLEELNSGSYLISEKQVIAVNLPISFFPNYPSLFPVVLCFVKQLSPKIVVSLDRACDRTDLPFANHVNHCIEYYSSLLESIEAVNMSSDALEKIERFLIQPNIEKIVLGRHQNPEKTSHWRNLFLQYGFAPLQFSNFAESQAEFLVQRTPVRGFHVEKRQCSLVLCWQRKELVSASAWRC